MEWKLASTTAVVIANAFNPSVVRESFLNKIGVIAPEEVQAGFVFSDQVANVSTARFTLLVLPQQLQVAPVERAGAGPVVGPVIIKLVTALPHTPYVAAGINFVWHLTPEDETVADATRRLFAGIASPLREAFEGPDANARFGFFASKDLGSVRLKLDVKPAREIAPDGAKGSELMQCSFNFHRDVAPATAPADVAELCDRWAEFEQLSEALVAKLSEKRA